MRTIISWVEILSNDFEKAVRFYSALLLVDLVPLDFGTEKWLLFLLTKEP
jgi:predicted enzyme related to lactoylglutathione lyase